MQTPYATEDSRREDVPQGSESEPTRRQKEARLNLRASTRQDALIRRAADAVDKSVTDFVLESATTAAERVLADRRWFYLDDAAWAEFEAALEREPRIKPRLREFMRQADVFDE